MSNNPMLNIAKDFDRISEAPLKRFGGLLLGRFATKPHSSARHLPFPMPLRTTLVCSFQLVITSWMPET